MATILFFTGIFITEAIHEGFFEGNLIIFLLFVIAVSYDIATLISRFRR